MVPRHTHFKFFSCSLLFHQKTVYQTIPFLTVEIIGIDYGKGTIHLFSGLHQSMGSSPRLGSPFRKGESARKRIQFLEHIVYIRNLLDSFSDNFPKILLNLFPNDKNQLVKSRIQSIVHRVIHNNLSGRPYLCQLLNSRTVAGTNSCCHHNQSRFLHLSTLSFALLFRKGSSNRPAKNKSSSLQTSRFSLAENPPCCYEIFGPPSGKTSVNHSTVRRGRINDGTSSGINADMSAYYNNVSRL